MKICITTYYGLRSVFLLIADSLKKLGHEIIDFHLLQYYSDINDKKDNYTDMFIDLVNKEKVDVILWWYITIPTNDFIKIISNTNSKNIFFNWDEPFNWDQIDMKNKAKYLDAVFITCEETCKKYIDHGTKQAFFCLPGFDSTIHYPIIDDLHLDKYEVDISLCCTNLYEDKNKYPNQIVNRKYIIDKIYDGMNKYNYTFHIYGPEYFRILYPKAYKGFITYEDTNYLFNKSKINLCTHVIGNKNKYLNERAILIAGSGGLLFIDNIKGLKEIFDINKEVVVINKDNFIEQIVNILSNYDNYINIRYNLFKKSKEYTWDAWAKTVHDCIIKF